MSSTANKTYSITKISSGAKAQASLWNTRYSQIEGALNDLSRRLTSIGNKSAIVQYQVPVTSNTKPGNIVYYNASAAQFEPALAQIRAVPGTNGASVQSEKSRIEGLVIDTETISGGSGGDVYQATILRNGYMDFSDQGALITTLFGGTAAAPGMYYLDAGSAGCVTNTPTDNYLRQPCISYYGDGRLSVVANYLAHDNHRHASIAVAASSFIQVGSSFQYTVPTGFGPMSDEITAVFVGGTLSTDRFEFSDSVIKTKQDEAPAADITIFNSYPFAYGDAVVRTVASENNLLKVSNIAGDVTLTVGEYEDAEQVEPADMAIATLSGGTAFYTPVVTSIEPGPGIFVRNRGLGKMQVSTADFFDSILFPDDVINVGTQMAASGDLSYLVFPAGIDSSAILRINFRWPMELKSGTIKFWCMSKGTGGSLDVDIGWIPFIMPISSPVSTNDIFKFTGIGLNINSGTQNTLTASQTEAQAFNMANMQGPCCIVIKLRAASPANAIYLHSYGCIING